MAAGELDEVPEIAVKVREHGDAAIVVIGGRADPFDPGGGKGGMVARKIVGGEEQEHSCASLIADGARLMLGGGAGEEDIGGVWRRVGRTDRDPAFALLGLVGVLDQIEAELADVKGERFVIVADEEGDVGQIGHGLLHTDERSGRASFHEPAFSLKVAGAPYTSVACLW